MAKQWEYLQLLAKSKDAGLTAIDLYNRVFHEYKDEATLLLFSNAWELLAKAVLVKKHKSIQQSSTPGFTITGEIAVYRLRLEGVLKNEQEDLIQQIISLRNIATHHLLPSIPVEIMHHLLFFGCKFYREVVSQCFPTHVKELPDNFLSLSFGDLTTYADKVQKLVSKVRKSAGEKKLVWLLERGITFDGSKYITEKQFENKFKGKRGIMQHLAIKDFINTTDMVRLVPVQAPKNFTADVTLRKGSAKDAALPVVVQKTEPDIDYPYLTHEIADKIGKNTNFVAKMATVLNIRGNSKYHQAIRSSKKGSIQKYNEAALNMMKKHLLENPSFNPHT